MHAIQRKPHCLSVEYSHCLIIPMHRNEGKLSLGYKGYMRPVIGNVRRHQRADKHAEIRGDNDARSVAS